MSLSSNTSCVQHKIESHNGLKHTKLCEFHSLTSNTIDSNWESKRGQEGLSYGGILTRPQNYGQKL